MAYAGGRRWPDLRTYSHKPIVQDFVPPSAWTEDANGHYLLVDLPDFKKEQVKLHVDTSNQIITISGERLTSDRSSIKRFEQTLKLPPNPDIDQISGKFEGEILHVTVPKRVVEKQEEAAKREAEIISSSNITEEIKQESSLNNKDENVKKDNAGAPNYTDENVKKDSAGEEDHHHDQVCQSERKEKNSKVDSFDEEQIEKWSKEPGQLEWAIKILRKNKEIILTAIIAFSLGMFVSRKLGPTTTHEAGPLN